MARWSIASVFRIGTAVVFTCLLQAGLAQRGGGRAGFSAHSASHASLGSFGGFRAAAPKPIMSRQFAPSRTGFAARGFVPQRSLLPMGRPGRSRIPYNAARYATSPEHRPDRYRRPYRGRYRQPYLNAAWSVWPGWTVPYYIGYPDDYGYDDDQEAQAQPDQQDAYGGAPYGGVQEPWPAYPPEQATASQPVAAPAPQEPVTLIFKDGRPPEQVRNYMMTGSTLYILDQKRREISTKDLDLTATADANRKAGVDFSLPPGTL